MDLRAEETAWLCLFVEHAKTCIPRWDESGFTTFLKNDVVIYSLFTLTSLAIAFHGVKVTLTVDEGMPSSRNSVLELQYVMCGPSDSSLDGSNHKYRGPGMGYISASASFSVLPLSLMTIALARG